MIWRTGLRGELRFSPWQTNARLFQNLVTVDQIILLMFDRLSTNQRSCSDRERGLQRCRASLSLHFNLSRYHHISLLKPSLRLSTMIFMWMLSQRAPIWNDISFKCVCVSRTLGAKFWLARTKKLLDTAELNPLLSAKGVEYIHRSISSVSVSFNRSSMKKASIDVARTEWNRRSKNIGQAEAQVWISLDNDGCVQWQEARAGIITRRRNYLPGRASYQTSEKDEQKGEALDRYWDNRYGLVLTDQWRDRSPYRTVPPSSCSLRERSPLSSNQFSCHLNWNESTDDEYTMPVSVRTTVSLNEKKSLTCELMKMTQKSDEEEKIHPMIGEFWSVQRANGQEIEVSKRLITIHWGSFAAVTRNNNESSSN